jgi:hypothetical protein
MLQHNFVAESSDHYETPIEAYEHIGAILGEVTKLLGKNTTSLNIYDPFFCNGKVIENFKSLGWSNITNVNRDFYQDVVNHTVPNHDVLVTNPPYSSDHIERILSYCKDSKECNYFALLLPNYSYRSNFFQHYFEGNFSEGLSQKPFFLAPINRYIYCRPKACETSKFISKETREYINQNDDGSLNHSPFLSSWLIFCHNHTDTIFNKLKEEEKKHKNFIVARTHKGCKWKIKKLRSNGKKKKKRKSKKRINNYGRNNNNNKRDRDIDKYVDNNNNVKKNRKKRRKVK